MHDSRILDYKTAELSQKFLRAAMDALGDKLDKVILYGSYARGDHNIDSDIDFFISAHIPQQEANKWRRNIRDRIPLLDLEYDVLVSMKVTETAIFNQYADNLPFFMNVINEGLVLYEQ